MKPHPSQKQSDKPNRPSKRAGRFGNIPVIFTILTPFMILLAIALGVTGYMWRRSTEKAVNLAADSIRAGIVQRINDHLVDFMGEPQRINQLNADLLRQGVLDPLDRDGLLRHFQSQIDVFKSVTSIYFGNLSGGIVNSGREGADGAGYIMMSDDFKAGPLKKYTSAGYGDESGVLSSINDFDARAKAVVPGRFRE